MWRLVNLTATDDAVLLLTEKVTAAYIGYIGGLHYPLIYVYVCVYRIIHIGTIMCP